MPRPTKSNRYPVQFLELADRFEENPKRAIHIPLESINTAKAFQLELHSFRKALRLSGEIEQYPNFDHCEIQMSKDKEHPGIVVIDKDYTVSGQAISKALEQLDIDEIKSTDQGDGIL